MLFEGENNRDKSKTIAKTKSQRLRRSGPYGRAANRKSIYVARIFLGVRTSQLLPILGAAPLYALHIAW